MKTIDMNYVFKTPRVVIDNSVHDIRTNDDGVIICPPYMEVFAVETLNDIALGTTKGDHIVKRIRDRYNDQVEAWNKAR